ncbi:hypothetical protein BT96DRAFT_488963 [Gymnopus androsaceus JB14]|uniref:CCHC-type domain-containing protein n=1 Tax=Gymnopus androsaceus JB14 TaxID=1447944 RepID=A0A6A4GNI0_9AGAR|nr:hypothetical protein BT96DRAFT_488963 [Gymnopus androsaceus JB14]
MAVRLMTGTRMLATTAAANFDVFIADFRDTFPAPKVQARTSMEYERILTELRLDAGKMLERHPETNDYMWRWFADELYRYAKLAKIENGCSSIISVRDALPPALKVKVSDEQKDWKAFTDAIKAVKKQEIEEGLERQRLAEETREQVAAAQKLWSNVPPIPETPSKALSRSFAGLGVEGGGFRGGYSGGSSRGGYCSGYGRSGFGGKGGGPGQKSSASLTPEQQVMLTRNAALLPHHPATPEGFKAYREQLASWANKWGREAVIDYEKPVPLKPGTAPIASGECDNCGLQGHQGRFCTVTGERALGAREREWRVLCGRELRSCVAQVNNVMDDDFELWLSGGSGNGGGSMD